MLPVLSTTCICELSIKYVIQCVQAIQFDAVLRSKKRRILGDLYHKSSSNAIFSLQVNQQQVSAFLTAGNVKLMLLHGGKSEESIRNFFQDVYELYVKVRSIHESVFASDRFC